MSEREYFFSGYCFHLDGARTVGIVENHRVLVECDCDYECCESRIKCSIGCAIHGVLSPEEGNCGGKT